ncbi:hypothetical protein DL93DRAFT_2162576 [Clavulina sp. PMI_390]|nr:hypothetical protein DL93DRAFT_2162576 [Clavulina sp. PMI_390]
MPSKATKAQAADNFSMRFSPGSAVFLVQGVRFRIPKALLQHNSGVLASMFEDAQGSDNDTIQLDDPLEPFEDLVAMLLTPLKSCLNPKLPIASDLKRLLSLFVVLRKYLIDELAGHVKELILPLITPESLPKRLSKHLTAADVIRIAHLVDDLSLAETARCILLDRIWARESSTPPLNILRFGQDLGEKEIIGAAYYQLVLLGRDAWPGLGLSAEEQKILLDGMIHCGERAQRILLSFTQHSSDGEKDPFIGLGKRKLHWFDYVGHVEIIIEVAHQTPVCSRHNYGDQFIALKKEVYSYFIPASTVTTAPPAPAVGGA